MIRNRQGTLLGIIILIVTRDATGFCIAPEGNGVYEKAAKEVMTLPVYPELTDAMEDYVVETILSFLQR